jgi:hypothetical protein
MTEKCAWFDCDKPAEVRVKRTGDGFCEDHFLLNVVRFGCMFEHERIEQPPPTGDSGL